LNSIQEKSDASRSLFDDGGFDINRYIGYSDHIQRVYLCDVNVTESIAPAVMVAYDCVKSDYRLVSGVLVCSYTQTVLNGFL